MKLRAQEQAIFRDLKWAMDKTKGNDEVLDSEYQTRIDINNAFSEKERMIIDQTYSGDEQNNWLNFESKDKQFRVQ